MVLIPTRSDIRYSITANALRYSRPPPFGGRQAASSISNRGLKEIKLIIELFAPGAAEKRKKTFQSSKISFYFFYLKHFTMTVWGRVWP